MSDQTEISQKIGAAFANRSNNRTRHDFKHFSSRIEHLIQSDAQSYARTDILGKALDFSEAVPFIAKAKSILQRTIELDLAAAPPKAVDEMMDATEPLLDAIQTAKNASAQTHDFHRLRQQSIEEIKTRLYHLSKAASILIQAANEPANPIGFAVDRADAMLSEIEIIKSDFAKQMNEAFANVDKSRELARDSAIEKYAVFFHNEAKSNSHQSWGWLAITAVFAAGTAWYGINSSDTILDKIESNPDLPKQAAYAFGFARFALFSVMLTATLWCGKSYKALRHNYVVNKHRENAFNSFAAFVTAAGDDQQTKNAVLLEATKSIFAPQHSGFSDGGKDTQQSTTFMEVFKSMPGSKSP